MEKPTTKIDTVRLVRRIRDAHREELKDASQEDRIAFFNSRVRTPRTNDKAARKSTT